MILESAILHIIPGQQSSFESSFRRASAIISAMKGYIRHSLSRCLETDNQYLLLVEWETLEDHTTGFRGSAQYAEWKALLHHYYDPFPVVEHYEPVSLNLVG